MTQSMTVTFWGVRGTIPTPGSVTQRYGGNTSCVEVRCDNRIFVFDAGTGLYPLGEQLDAKEFDILLSHTHVDHVIGFPFLSQNYKKDCTVRVWAGHLLPDYRLEDVMRRLMSPPLFPITLERLKARVSFHDFTAGEAIAPPGCKEAGIRLRTLPLHHPDRATAYRIEYAGHAVCYVTDVEHRSQTLDTALVEFIRDADFFIYDSTFDDAQFERYQGWGHSTWQHAMRLGEAAGVKTVVLFHHDPSADDAALEARERAVSGVTPRTVIAKEGMTLRA